MICLSVAFRFMDTVVVVINLALIVNGTKFRIILDSSFLQV
jgi:hypothetical protein